MGFDSMHSAGETVEAREMKEVDKGDVVVGRVSSGPCASGHGGQVISRENSHGPKAYIGPELFSKCRGPTIVLPRVPRHAFVCISDQIRGAVGGEVGDRQCGDNDRVTPEGVTLMIHSRCYAEILERRNEGRTLAHCGVPIFHRRGE